MNTHQKEAGDGRGGFYADPTSVGIKITPEELKRVRLLYVTILIVQAIGGMASLLFVAQDEWWTRLANGLLLASLPGFILGLPVQAHFHPGSCSQNRGFVIRIGCTALAATLMGVFSR